MAQDLTINKSQRIKRSHSGVSCSFSLYNVFVSTINFVIRVNACRK